MEIGLKPTHLLKETYEKQKSKNKTKTHKNKQNTLIKSQTVRNKTVAESCSLRYCREFGNLLFFHFRNFILFNYNHIKLNNKHVLPTTFHSPNLFILTLCIMFRK